MTCIFCAYLRCAYVMTEIRLPHMRVGAQGHSGNLFGIRRAYSYKHRACRNIFFVVPILLTWANSENAIASTSLALSPQTLLNLFFHSACTFSLFKDPPSSSLPKLSCRFGLCKLAEAPLTKLQCATKQHGPNWPYRS